MIHDANIPILKQLRLPPAPISKRLTNAIGVLKGKHLDGLSYQRKVRREWETRWKKQIRLARAPRSRNARARVTRG